MMPLLKYGSKINYWFVDSIKSNTKKVVFMYTYVPRLLFVEIIALLLVQKQS